MKLKILIPILIIIFSTNIIAQSSFEKGMVFYNNRAENAIGIKAPIKNINKAIVQFKLSNYERAGEYLLKSIYFKSTYCYPEGDKNRKIVLEKAKVIGDDLLLKHPNSAGIHYWYAVILGSWAKEVGVFKAAREGVVDKLKEEAQI